MLHDGSFLVQIHINSFTQIFIEHFHVTETALDVWDASFKKRVQNSCHHVAYVLKQNLSELPHIVSKGPYDQQSPQRICGLDHSDIHTPSLLLYPHMLWWLAPPPIAIKGNFQLQRLLSAFVDICTGPLLLAQSPMSLCCNKHQHAQSLIAPELFSFTI